MKPLPLVLAIALSLSILSSKMNARFWIHPSGESANAQAATPSVCDENALRVLWAHVYNPQRLVVRHPCVRATGTIVLLRPEADGDIHIQIRMDPPYQNLVAPGNSRQDGNLVVEPICMHTVTQEDAKAACAGFSYPVTIFPKGTHVAIRGSLVFDRQHGWSEIHPLEKMVRIQ
ncbi:MAG: hypothetical protein ACRD5M_06355 [Candidatus Acidiferrales bacterium]